MYVLDVLEIEQTKKMVLYHRKFEEHCFLVMATIISCLLCVKNYCKCFLDYLIPSSP